MNGDPIHRAEKVCIFWNFCIYSFLDFFQHGIHSPENSVLLSSWPKITSCWWKYFLIFDTIYQIWNLLNMDYLSLLQVSVDDWNSSPVGFSKKKKSTVKTYETSCWWENWPASEIQFIAILFYFVGIRSTFCIFRKISWILFNGCQPVVKILKENIWKPWKLWIINSWKW